MRRPRDLALDLWVLVLGAVLVAPAWTRSGYGLARDLVFVPRFALTDDALGAGDVLPRAVPLDTVLALVTSVVDGAVVYRAAVLGVLVLAGWGAHRLGRDHGPAARLLMATAAVWNPYTVERLAMGQWALLAGYAALWWLLPAARRAVAGDRAALGAVLGCLTAASLTPTGGLLAVLVLLAVATTRPARPGRRALLVALGLAWQVPWVLPSLLGDATTVSDPAGVAAFAARAERAGGTLPTLLSGGGIWNPAVVPPSASTMWGLVGTGAVVVALVLGGRAVLRDHRDAVAAGGVGLVLALLPVVPGGRALLEAVVEHVPGGGLLRDSQKWLGVYVVVVVLCAGAAVERLRSRAWPAEAGVLVAVASAAVPLVVLPDAPRETWQALRPVSYPDDLARAVRTLTDAPRDTGDAVTLPWASYRRMPWGLPLSAPDPVARWADHAVVVRSDLAVPGGEVRGEDARAAAVGDVVEGSPDDLVDGLRGLGVGWVLVYEGTVPAEPTVPDGGLPGLDPVVEGDVVTLYRVEGAQALPEAHAGRRPLLLVVDVVWLLVGLAGAAGAVVGARVVGRRTAPR